MEGVYRQMPKFSLNIATYNQLPILKLTFEALKHQTFTDYEVIVCDDGSSDGTKEWMGREHPDVKYFWQEDEGFRLAKSKNNGIREASGEYFVSLEADVIPHKNLLRVYNFWIRPNTVAYGVRHDIETLPESIDFEKMDEMIVSRDFRTPALSQVHEVSNPWRLCSGCNVAFPTKMLQDVGGWNENFKHYGIDDYEVCLRLAMAGAKFIALPEAYGYHLKHDLRETTEENVKMLEEMEAQYENSIGV